jgi:hypothetical protein
VFFAPDGAPCGRREDVHAPTWYRRPSGLKMVM